MNVLRKMKTYAHSCYGRYIPIRKVAMFLYATEFNGDVSDWDVSSVTAMGVSFHFS